MEYALGSEKLNLPPTSVNIVNVQSQWKLGCNYDSDERRSKEDELILESLEKRTCKVVGRY